MTRPRLLFVVTEDWYFCSHRLAMAQAAQAAGYDVGVVTRVRDHGDLIQDAGLRLIPFENARSGLNPLTELATLMRLVRVYRRERPDIVHHVAIKPVLYGSIAARLTKVGRVVNALAGLGWLSAKDTSLSRWLRPVVRALMARLLRSGRTIVQNRDDAFRLAQLGVPPSQITHIPGSGVDLTVFRPGPEPTGVPVVVFLARLLWDKGIGEFVEAARILREQGTAATFVLAGDPDLANASAVPKGTMAEWVREGIVSHLGWVRDVPALLTASHIVCLPSFYGEGIPKSLIEAAAAGRPIVTTDMPGCREIVHHEDNGLLVPARDPQTLAAALKRLLVSPELRRKMGARGRARAEAEYGLEHVIQQTLAVYAEAIV